MVWNTTNYKGEPVTWYSQETIDKIKKVVLTACECCGECQTEFSKKDYCDFAEILKIIEGK